MSSKNSTRASHSVVSVISHLPFVAGKSMAGGETGGETGGRETERGGGKTDGRERENQKNYTSGTGGMIYG